MVLIALRRAAVVPEQGDVQFPAFHRTVLDLSDAVSDPTGQYGAAAADADQTQILRTRLRSTISKEIRVIARLMAWASIITVFSAITAVSSPPAAKRKSLIRMADKASAIQNHSGIPGNFPGVPYRICSLFDAADSLSASRDQLKGFALSLLYSPIRHLSIKNCGFRTKFP